MENISDSQRQKHLDLLIQNETMKHNEMIVKFKILERRFTQTVVCLVLIVVVGIWNIHETQTNRYYNKQSISETQKNRELNYKILQQTRDNAYKNVVNEHLSRELIRKMDSVKYFNNR